MENEEKTVKEIEEKIETNFKKMKACDDALNIMKKVNNMVESEGE